MLVEEIQILCLNDLLEGIGIINAVNCVQFDIDNIHFIDIFSYIKKTSRE